MHAVDGGTQCVQSTISSADNTVPYVYHKIFVISNFHEIMQIHKQFIANIYTHIQCTL